MSENRRKEFKIPNQIDGSFHIWRFVTLKEFLLLLPSFILGYVLYNYVFFAFGLQTKAFFAFLPAVLTIAFIFIRPMPERKNINLFHMMKWRMAYNRRQKYFQFKRKF